MRISETENSAKKQIPNVRARAASTIDAVLAGDESIGTAVNRLSSTVSAVDLRLFRQLTSGTVRWLRFLDVVIEQAARRPVEKIDSGLRSHLRVAVYQILFLGRVPARAAVFEAVELAKRTSGVGASKFANGVLRSIARKPERDLWQLETDDAVSDLALNQSHPEFLVRSWVDQFGWRQTENLLATNNQPKGSLSVMGEVSKLVERLSAEGGSVELSSISPVGLMVDGVGVKKALKVGGYVQDQASQAAALVPLPRAGETIFDAAAAPGGKSLALLAYQPRVKIVAADSKPRRIRRLVSNLGESVQILAADALQPAVRGGFDRVVFDAPCSGTGTLRKHPELKWRVSGSEIDRLSAIQRSGLASLAPLVAPGGLLCYITCSIERQENQDVVDRFLETNPGWQLEPLQQPEALPESLQRSVLGPGRWQLLPADDHDGATVHVLRRPMR